jgi:uncharacterized protein YggU (UPF0235/DUF167 family)
MAFSWQNDTLTHLLKFLARLFGAGRNQTEITTGHIGRHTLLRIQAPFHLPREVPAAAEAG